MDPATHSQKLTDEQIRQGTIGELKPHDAPITLVEYDPEWPRMFTREERRIRSALGDRALMIEHIGSTAVPGLMAKPIIDILLIVEDSSDERSHVPALEAEGYVLRIREHDWHEHRLFKGPDININMHVFSRGSSEIERHLAFRDWLRTHPDDFKLYAETKRRLAGQQWHYLQNYAEAKSEVVETILARASSKKKA